MTAQPSSEPNEITAHAGTLALAAARSHGVRALFTLSGAHIFPFYDAATTTQTDVRLVDVRHEQSAVFAAEAAAKLTRRPGLAAVTAGPGVTNTVSAVAQAHASGVPMLVLGGRAPAFRWGTGALQELDHPPLLEPVTKSAATAATAAEVYGMVDEAMRLASMAHRGPTFVDVPMDQLFSHATASPWGVAAPEPVVPDADAITRVAQLLAAAQRPVLVLGSDVWMDGADDAARDLVEALDVPVVPNGMGRGILPGGHPLLVTKARSTALRDADLVVVAGAPLDFRLQYGVFGDPANPTRVVHIADSPSQVATHVELAGAVSGSMSQAFTLLLSAVESTTRRASTTAWVDDLREAVSAAESRDTALLSATAPGGIHPARVYGALLPLLADDTIVIADGGDFV